MNSLMSLLDAILASIDDPNTLSLCGQLQGLIGKINDWVSKGVLTPAQAKPFLDSAASLQKTFGCCTASVPA